MSLQEKLTQIKQTLEIDVLITDDQILIFQIDELSLGTIKAWETTVGMLMKETALINKRIYDVRNVTNFPLEAVQAAIRIRRNPSVHLHFVVILVTNPMVRRFINLILTIQPGGRTRVMGDREEAINWLNEQTTSPLA